MRALGYLATVHDVVECGYDALVLAPVPVEHAAMAWPPKVRRLLNRHGETASARRSSARCSQAA